ncbi:MAG: hypothetical protein ACTSU2_06855 [Promethearchaeota archaeon]
MGIEYQDFIVYSLNPDGTYNELDIQKEELGNYLHPEEVLLVIRQDLRRLFIWKGPRSPVRKRFISSRVASKIQEDLRREGGRHLKIVSVDAGDEPLEFLSAFDLEPMEVDDNDRLEDMRYVRNIDRIKEKEESLKKKLEERRKKKEKGYQSPLLKEMEEAEKAAAVSNQEINTQDNGASSQGTISSHPTARKPVVKRVINSDQDWSMKPVSSSNSLNGIKKNISRERSKLILKKVLETAPPEGKKRMNIIIGQELYAPSIKKSIVLGKEIEKVEWSVVEDLPGGIIDLDMDKIRVFIDEKFGTINAIEIFKNEENNSQNSSKSSTTKKKRTLAKIPTSKEE